MEAECGGQGLPGFKCVVFLSPCRETGRPLQKTLPEPCALFIPEQWDTSASPTRVTAGILTIIILLRRHEHLPMNYISSIQVRRLQVSVQLGYLMYLLPIVQ